MGFLDRLLGRTPEPTIKMNTLSAPRPTNDRGSVTPGDEDALAVERYRYLLRTAPPDQLERAHTEAFARLTPEQRDIVRRDLEGVVPPGEAPRTTDPQELARVATRAEVRAPGSLERSFASGPAAPGVAGSFLQTFAAVFIGTSVAQALFGGLGSPYPAEMSTVESDEGSASSADSASDASGFEEAGGFGDMGGDFGDFGGFDI